MKNEYYVNEVATFFGVSRDTIRLYDKVGILSPKKNERNNYRIYSREDLICLDYVMRLRKINLSLEDIRVLINESSIERAEAMMQLQEKILEDKIEELINLKIMVSDYQKSFSNVIQNMGEIFVKESPTLLYMDVETSMMDTMYEFSGLQKAHVPIFTFVCKKELFLSNQFIEYTLSGNDRNKLFTYAITMIDDEGLSKRKDFPQNRFRIIPPRKCVYSVARCYTNVNYDDFLKVRDYIIKHNLKLVDDVLLRVASVRNNRKQSVDYYEIWAPIAD
ncbi:MerR family transcriptional regulator [Anaerovorax sp. IOR16]|uniref:MerR family transcriptional regulator n=1 Tax=Anaerovorax sp. IOR16 TaxID=2773458 RepID=UPI0019D128C7|nr:MerR family transcriptional regulator [Anaerovorax sp. IOR16]